MTSKIAISLPDEQVVAAKNAVAAGRAASVSAYVSAAIAEHERSERLVDILADLDAKHGAPTEEDYAWARAALGLR